MANLDGNFERGRFMVLLGSQWLSTASADNRRALPQVDAIMQPGPDTIWIGRNHAVNAPLIASYAAGGTSMVVWMPSNDGKTARKFVVQYTKAETRPFSLSAEQGPAIDWCVLTGTWIAEGPVDIPMGDCPPEVQAMR